MSAALNQVAAAHSSSSNTSSATLQSSPGGAQSGAASANASSSAAKACDASSDEEDSDDDEPIAKAPIMTEAYMHNLEDALLNSIRVRNAVLRENENLRESLRRRHMDADQAETTLSVHVARARDEAAQAADAHAQARATLLAASGSDPELREQFIALRAEKEAWEKTLDEVKTERDEARSEVKDLEESVENMEDEAVGLEDMVDHLQEEKDELQQDHERLQEAHDELLADSELAEEELEEAHSLRRAWRAICRQRDALLLLYRIPIPSDPDPEPEEPEASNNEANARQQQQPSNFNGNLKRNGAQIDGGLFEIRLSNGVAITFNKPNDGEQAAQAPPPKKIKLSNEQQQPSKAGSSSSSKTNDKAKPSGSAVVKSENGQSGAASACVDKPPIDKKTRAEHIDALCQAGICLHE